jgi:hypothetical protein
MDAVNPNFAMVMAVVMAGLIASLRTFALMTFVLMTFPMTMFAMMASVIAVAGAATALRRGRLLLVIARRLRLRAAAGWGSVGAFAHKITCMAWGISL